MVLPDLIQGRIRDMLSLGCGDNTALKLDKLVEINNKINIVYFVLSAAQIWPLHVA